MVGQRCVTFVRRASSIGVMDWAMADIKRRPARLARWKNMHNPVFLIGRGGGGGGGEDERACLHGHYW